MKLRLHEGSVRLRLDAVDLSTLQREGHLETVLSFGPGPKQRLSFAIELRSEPAKPDAEFSDGRLCVVLPRTMAISWAAGAETGLYTVTQWGVALSIEKDFVRKSREGRRVE